ncbi:fumarylacetoacetate hydrolase family protein [Anaerobacillus isosaccharinicus]|uniref:Fumarylacetoacetate hydrolase n=1 Tax=Anaerobacillus isosaccharinicus TaxID=1532552 RepID=A0A1S2LJD9_9BACI|nr:fumarylacetoacetate hydrolase family protein [Anaerobacillus isosaccharinicus]MBA5588313.1 fumarylacetoacetate hydrolase family protein [Anaerobacillus isosaccharinicus]QOY38251.1 fumarylacetoacetate hydrolase family protein [Anaerobacillus isosaccharinicus]
MRLATVKIDGEEKGAIITQKGAVLIKTINENLKGEWDTDLFNLIQSNQLVEMTEWFNAEGNALVEDIKEYIATGDIEYAPLYRRPRKIWGIGLNYVEHASDLKEKAPNTEPASFMKPDTTIIGPNDTIEIPYQSERTTAESELGVIIGKSCKDVSEEEASTVIAGFTTIIDMTAEDILEKNPRYLTRSKSFDTFFSFGPQLVTPDEVKNVLKLSVSTVINGQVHRKNVISNMTFNPWHLVSFHSKVMSLLPGDIISTGTPGAIHINDGDVVECQIDGFETLINNVKDLKVNNK